jgi:hypothetical protein
MAIDSVSHSWITAEFMPALMIRSDYTASKNCNNWLGGVANATARPLERPRNTL